MRGLFLGSGGRVGKLLKAAWTNTDVVPVWHTREDFDITTDTAALAQAVEACDAIICLAGATHHGSSSINDANSVVARQVLDSTKENPVFLLSTAAVYGTSSGALSEDTVPTPVSDYGRDKANMEAMAHAHSARSIVLRLGNVAGADALLGVDRDSYILDQFPDGTYPCRSYIGPKLLADTLAELIQKHKDLPDILNISTSQAVSMDALLKAAGKPWDNRVAGPTAITRVELCTDLLEKFTQMPHSTAHTIVEDWKSVKDAQ
jgi:UDP-glucose 4-epimerase